MNPYDAAWCARLAREVVEQIRRWEADWPSFDRFTQGEPVRLMVALADWGEMVELRIIPESEVVEAATPDVLDNPHWPLAPPDDDPRRKRP
jgi:hypothetical protein